MTPCACGHSDPNPPYVGVQKDYEYRPALVLYNCRACGTTRAIPWEEATDEQKRAGEDAELFRHAGMMG